MVLLPLHSALQIKKTLRAFLSGRWTRLLEEQVNQVDKVDNKVSKVDNKGGEVDDKVENKEQGNEVSGQLDMDCMNEIQLKNEPLEDIAASPHEDHIVLVDIDQESEEKYILKKEDGWSCSFCGKILRSKKAMRTHIEEKCKLRQKQKEDLEIDTKEDLEETEDPFSHLPRHRRNAANFLRRKETDLTCNFCKVTLSSFQEMKEHKKRYVDGNEWTCPEKDCKQRFSGSMFRKYLEAHMNAHRGITEYTCEECGKEFTGRIHYALHRKTHQERVRQSCELCPGMPPKYPRDLVSHMRNYHDEDQQKLSCDICGRAFRRHQKRSLLDHIQVHENKREFPCNDCPLKFNTLRYLKLHKKTVHEKRVKKDYKCDTCKKEFRSNAKLIEHKYIHSGQKPFQCTFCGRAFAQGANLKSHSQRCSENGNLKSHSQKCSENSTKKKGKAVAIEVDTLTKNNSRGVRKPDERNDLTDQQRQKSKIESNLPA